jgi:uncharacterized repeat protein (TIGR03803 family)
MNCADGAGPEAALIADSAGNLYGTTISGGAYGQGTVFGLSHTKNGWKEKALYSFCPNSGCSDGDEPVAGLVRDSAGNLYGTTTGGGSGGFCQEAGECGVAFKLTRSGDSWTESVIYNFCSAVNCTDGVQPVAGLTLDGSGNLYGTTVSGGASSLGCPLGCGTVFELTPSNGGWSENVLHSFGGPPDGAGPMAGVIFDKQGNLYGTTYEGGGNQQDGAVFEMTPSNGGWAESVIYSFCSAQGCTDGVDPLDSLVIDNSGNLYGTTTAGGDIAACPGQSGAPGGCGTVFELTPSNGVWNESVLHEFCSAANCSDGESPVAGVTLDSKNNLYSTTRYGGKYGDGTVWQLSYMSGVWKEKEFSFNVTDGSQPLAGVLLEHGVLYGTTQSSGSGVVWEIVP